MNAALSQEAEALGRYLLGKPPGEKAVALYVAANEKKPIRLSPREEKVFRFLVKHRWSAGLIDSALGFSKAAQGGIRRKILYMSAILETQPEYAELFLPKERSWFYNLFIFWVGARAVLKAMAGKVLLLLII